MKNGTKEKKGMWGVVKPEELFAIIFYEMNRHQVSFRQLREIKTLDGKLNENFVLSAPSISNCLHHNPDYFGHETSEDCKKCLYSTDYFSEKDKCGGNEKAYVYQKGGWNCLRTTRTIFLPSDSWGQDRIDKIKRAIRPILDEEVDLS